LEPYNSSDPAVSARHVELAATAGIDVLVSAWYGPVSNNPTEKNFSILLRQAQPRGVRAALMLETDSDVFFPTLDAQQKAIAYALAAHVNDQAYFRYNGRPVLFFWRPRAIWLGASRGMADSAATVAAWKQLRDEVDPNHSSIWITEGDYFPYLSVFDGIMPYSIAWSSDPGRQLASYAKSVPAYSSQTGNRKLWVATAMPGYDDTGLIDRADRFKGDRQEGAYYRRTFAAAAASNPDWINITSFNEWVEGHQIEPSVSYKNLYLDLTREMVAAWKSSG
jgi:hypothetical protein